MKNSNKKSIYSVLILVIALALGGFYLLNKLNEGSPSVEIIFPNGGEKFQSGESINVRWSSNHISNSEVANIGLIRTDGIYNGVTVDSQTLEKTNSNSFVYVIPETVPTGEYIIAVYSCSAPIEKPQECLIGDYSDSSFTITKKSDSSAFDLINKENTYSDTQFGFSFKYPNPLSVTQSGEIISLKNIDTDIPDWITIRKVAGNSVTDSNGKFGKITYSFLNGQWTVSRSNEKDGSMSAPVPVDMQKNVFRTATGDPVFKGAIPTEGWGRFVYIVALSETKFLIVEGPDTDATYDFVKNIKTL